MTGPNRSVRIVVTGYRSSLVELFDALAAQPRIEVADAVTMISDAAFAVGGGGIDVVVHAVSGEGVPRDDLAEIRRLTRAPIVLLAEEAGAALFEDALDADVADVVVLPEPVERLAFAVCRAARTASAPAAAPASPSRRARVLTVFSPKGGTGKTVISTSLAAAIAKGEGRRTLLLDLDLQFGDAAIMLGIEPERTLHDLVTGPGTLDADKFAGYLTHHDSGLDVLPAPFRPEEGELVTEQRVEQLFEVAAPGYDVIVVDTSPAFHGPMLSALDRTDTLLLVCTPEVPTLKNVRLGIETLRQLSFPDEHTRLVLNRAEAGAGLQRPEVEGALGVPVSYQLPTAPDVPAAVNQGTPLTLSAPLSPFAWAVQGMCPTLVGPQAQAQPWSELYSVPSGNGIAAKVRSLS